MWALHLSPAESHRPEAMIQFSRAIWVLDVSRKSSPCHCNGPGAHNSDCVCMCLCVLSQEVMNKCIYKCKQCCCPYISPKIAPRAFQTNRWTNRQQDRHFPQSQQRSLAGTFIHNSSHWYKNYDPYADTPWCPGCVNKTKWPISVVIMWKPMNESVTLGTNGGESEGVWGTDSIRHIVKVCNYEVVFIQSCWLSAGKPVSALLNALFDSDHTHGSKPRLLWELTKTETK